MALIRTRTGWQEPAPTHCPAGHPLLPGKVLVGWLPCGTHHGHRTHQCHCGAITYTPAVDQTCGGVRPGGL